MNTPGHWVPVWTALLYLLVALCGLWGAEHAIAWLAAHGWAGEGLHDYHHFLGVSLASVLLFFFMHRALARLKAAEAAHGAQHKQWIQALDETGDGTAYVDLASGTCVCSPRWNRTLDNPDRETTVTPAELFGTVHPDDRSAALARFSGLQEQGASQCRCEHRVRTRDGRHRWMLDRGYASLKDGQTHLVLQRHDIHAQKLVEHAQDFLLRLGSRPDPVETLQAMVGFVRTAFEVDIVLAGTLEEKCSAVRTVAVAHKNGMGNPFRYTIDGAPCEEVLRDGYRVYIDGVARRFPADTMLAARGAEAYAGVTLNDHQGRPIGLLVLVDQQPVRDAGALERVLRMFAERAGAELARMTLESQLQTKTQMLDGIFENIPAAIFAKGRDERFLLGNPNFEQVAGLPRGGCVGRLCSDVFGEELAGALRPSNNEVLEFGRVIRTQQEMALPGGTRELSLVRFPLRNPAGRIYALAGIAVDVTEQAKVERERDEGAARLRGLYESVFDSIVLIDEKSRIVDCNARALELFGASADQIRKLSIWDLSPRFQASGETSKSLGHRHFVQLRSGRRIVFDWRHRRLDGTVIDCEIAAGLLQVGGRRLYSGVIRDTTERQAALRELRLLHAAANATAAGFVVTDEKGNIQWTNPAFTRLTGYTSEEVIGHNPRILRSNAQSAEFYQRMWATITRGEVWSGELQNRRKDGTLYHERMVISPVRGADGAISSFVAVKENVTNERGLEEQLRHAQRLESVGMLAGGIAHDLNNVLSPILLSIDLMMADAPTPRQVERLALMAQAARRGSGIVKQVLTFARGSDGERVPHDLRHLVRDIADLARETFPRNIGIVTEFAPDAGSVVGDVTQLHQVLLNLAVNARDAMPRGGTLTFRLRRVVLTDEPALRARRLEPGEHVELAITDTGTGMPPEVMEHLFEPFFTTKPRGKGTGLGLSTVHGIIRSHGGGIAVQSGLGKGSTFTIHLPLAAAAVPAPRGPAKPARIDGAGRLVLLVDDEDPIRTVGSLALGRLGFKVVAAADGFEALALVRERPGDFALAIVDQMMPRMNGTELSRELVALRPDLRIISSTGFGPDSGGDRDCVEEMRALGIVTRLEKPYTSHDLVAALEAELGPNARPLQRQIPGVTPPPG